MKIDIFASSDVHGHIVPYDYGTNRHVNNSLANLSTAYKELKDENSILIDNGDMIKGNFIEKFVFYDKQPSVELMNFMRYDIWNLGNHEFNYGLDNIYRLVENFNGTSLLANSNGEFMDYKIIERSGIKIAFIGINTPLVNTFEKGELGDFRITDPVDVIDKIIDKIHDKVDAIVGLFHVGIGDENGVLHAGAESILRDLKNLEYLDCIIIGHTHDGFEEKYYKHVLATQPIAYARGLTRLSLEFDDNKKLISKKAKIIDVRNYKPDQNIIDIYEPYNKKILDYNNKVIGFLENVEGDFDYDLGDGPLVHLMTAIMRTYYPCDVVAFQIDSIYTWLNDGAFRRSDIAKVYSYSGGEVSLYEITGKDLRDYMIWSSQYYDYNETLYVNPKRKQFKYKTFDIFGNIKYTLDYRREERITKLQRLDGSDIKDDDKLIIGMNEYRMNYLLSQKGPLSDRHFEQIASSENILKDYPVHGTIREIAEIYFEQKDDSTFHYNGKINFKIKY